MIRETSNCSQWGCHVSPNTTNDRFNYLSHPPCWTSLGYFTSQCSIKRYFEECQNSLYLLPVSNFTVFMTNHIHVQIIIFMYILLIRSSNSGGINSRPSGSFDRICNIQHPLAEETPRRMSLSPCPINGDAPILYLNNRKRTLPPPQPQQQQITAMPNRDGVGGLTFLIRNTFQGVSEAW